MIMKCPPDARFVNVYEVGNTPGWKGPLFIEYEYGPAPPIGVTVIVPLFTPGQAVDVAVKVPANPGPTPTFTEVVP